MADDGSQHMKSFVTTHFGLDFSDPTAVPSPADIKDFVLKSAADTSVVHDNHPDN
jgi:hypothetical protein